MQQYSLKEHFVELKNRLLIIVCFFCTAFAVSYLFKESIYDIFLTPLAELNHNGSRKIIYTGLTEAFASYIKLSLFSAFCFTIPIIAYQVYRFILPGLVKNEKIIILLIIALSPMLFYIGALFVFYFVMPKAWSFFLSYETLNTNVNDVVLPLIMEARISEYLHLVMQLTIVFGLAFQLPVIVVIFALIGLVDSTMMKNKRRIAIVCIFIIAAIFTPPDVISQIALAIPLILLYELSIILCKLVKK